MTTTSKTILYVDDDADDRDLLGEVIKNVAPWRNVTFAENGLEAMQLLNDIEETTLLPCLIVLDLNMPYLNGIETFKRIKSNPRLENIPLAILSSGESPADKVLFSKEGVPYFIKPTGIPAFENIARQMETLCSC